MRSIAYGVTVAETKGMKRPYLDCDCKFIWSCDGIFESIGKSRKNRIEINN